MSRKPKESTEEQSGNFEPAEEYLTTESGPVPTGGNEQPPEPVIHAKDIFNDAEPTAKPKHSGLYKLTRKSDGIVFYISEIEAKEFKTRKKLINNFDVEGPLE